MLSFLQNHLGRVDGKVTCMRCLDCKSIVQQTSSSEAKTSQKDSYKNSKHEPVIFECAMCTSKNLRPVATLELRTFLEDFGILLDLPSPKKEFGNLEISSNRRQAGFHMEDRQGSTSPSSTTMLISSTRFQEVKSSSSSCSLNSFMMQNKDCIDDTSSSSIEHNSDKK